MKRSTKAKTVANPTVSQDWLLGLRSGLKEAMHAADAIKLMAKGMDYPEAGAVGWSAFRLWARLHDTHMSVQVKIEEFLDAKEPATKSKGGVR